MDHDRLSLERRGVYIWEGILFKLSEICWEDSTFVQTNIVRRILKQTTAEFTAGGDRIICGPGY